MRPVAFDKRNDQSTDSTNFKRPQLSIITNPKRSWKSFFGSPKNHPISPSSTQLSSSPSSLSQSSFSPPPLSFDSAKTTTDEAPSPLHVNPMRYNSDDISNVHSIKSFQGSLKMIRFLRSSSKKSTKGELFTPIPPEPIFPTLVDWSPKDPISPPPWEQDDFDLLDQHKHLKQHSLSDNSLMNNQSDFDLSSLTDTQSNDSSTLVGDTQILQRRFSCPNMNRLSLQSSISSSTLVENNDIISITVEHTRNVTLLKKNNPPTEKKPVLKTCQRTKERAAQAAAQGETIHVDNPLFSVLCEESLKYHYIPNVFDPETGEPLVKIASIKPRKYQLRRKVNWKKEAKALMKWHHSLESLLQQPPLVQSLTSDLPPEKITKNLCTRRFIIKELFTTEVTFWNQLYYTKIVKLFYAKHCLFFY